MKSILTDSDLKDFLNDGQGQPVVVFKHSTTCPISAAAYRAVEEFEKQHGDVPVGMIRVIEERPLSLQFAADVGIAHASPQAIVMKDGQPVWNASHYSITATALEGATKV